MAKAITKDTLFKPSRSRAETKAEITDNAARAIIDAEAAAREAKSAKLRAARLAREADTAKAPPAKADKKPPKGGKKRNG